MARILIRGAVVSIMGVVVSSRVVGMAALMATLPTQGEAARAREDAADRVLVVARASVEAEVVKETEIPCSGNPSRDCTRSGLVGRACMLPTGSAAARQQGQAICHVRGSGVARANQRLPRRHVSAGTSDAAVSRRAHVGVSAGTWLRRDFLRHLGCRWMRLRFSPQKIQETGAGGPGLQKVVGHNDAAMIGSDRSTAGSSVFAVSAAHSMSQDSKNILDLFFNEQFMSGTNVNPLLDDGNTVDADLTMKPKIASSLEQTKDDILEDLLVNASEGQGNIGLQGLMGIASSPKTNATHGHSTSEISDADDDLFASHVDEDEGEVKKHSVHGKEKLEEEDELEPDDLWAPDSEDEKVKITFKTFKEEDLKDPSKGKEVGVMTGIITPKIKKKLDKNIELTNNNFAEGAGDGLFKVSEVVCSTPIVYIVDLKTRTCTWKRWEKSGIPCPHAISCIMHDEKDPVSYVDKSYSVDMYKKAYGHIVYPCKDKTEWEKMHGPINLPPAFQRQVETKKEIADKRKREAEEKRIAQKKEAADLKAAKRVKYSAKMSQADQDNIQPPQQDAHFTQGEAVPTVAKKVNMFDEFRPPRKNV
ncbi:hypothetical protein ACQ4PT_053802 [Festuca glaucescens]